MVILVTGYVGSQLGLEVLWIAKEKREGLSHTIAWEEGSIQKNTRHSKDWENTIPTELRRHKTDKLDLWRALNSSLRAFILEGIWAGKWHDHHKVLGRLIWQECTGQTGMAGDYWCHLWQ